jgi:ribosomal protein L24E
MESTIAAKEGRVMSSVAANQRVVSTCTFGTTSLMRNERNPRKTKWETEWKFARKHNDEIEPKRGKNKNENQLMV